VLFVEHLVLLGTLYPPQGRRRIPQIHFRYDKQFRGKNLCACRT
jgi:ribosome-binding factor A